jgi:transposase InsO family protein
MIDSIRQKTGASIRRVCQVLDVPRSSYHAADKPTATRLDDEVLGDRIEGVFREHRRRYGYRRIHDELRDLGLNCCPARVRRLMKERRLRALQPKNFIPRTSDGKASRPSPNLLAAESAPSRINQAWAGDITYIPTSKGWRYLAIVIDLHSRRIIGWSLSDHMRAELVCAALKQALRSRSDYQGVIFHSDRGSQYGSHQFRDLLNQAGARQSMSARANPYDNAWTESCIGTIKHEMLQGGEFIDDTDARTELFSYIDGYYNTRRKHSSLGYRTPSQHELTKTKN